MLDMIRKKQKSVIIQIVFWTIIAAFVGTIFLVWGKGEMGGGEDGQMAAVVNGTRIDLSSYHQTYQNMTDFYREVYGAQFNPEMEKRLQLKRQALQTLIDQTLMLQEGKRLGIRVSKQELVESIAQIGAFQIDGQFDKDRYVRVLASQRMTPEQFEKGQEEQLIRERTLKHLNEGITVDDAEIEEAFRHQEEMVEVDFVRIAPATLEEKVAVDETALKQFYSEKMENFRLPEMISLAYLEFDPDDFRDQATHTPEELEKFYRRNIDRFEIEEQVKIAHIFFRLPVDTDQAAREKIRQKAETALKKIRSGESFQELAKKHSEDPASAAKGGEIGFFSRATMPPALDEAAFSLPVNAVSEPLQSPAGYHLLKVLERIDPGIQPLETVKEEAKTGLVAQKTRELAFDKAMDTYNIHRKQGNLEDAAKSAGMEIKTTPLFSRGEEAGDLGMLPETAERGFSQEAGKMWRPFHHNDKVILFAVKERRSSRIPELAEIKDDVEKSLRQEKASQLAAKTAEEILADLRQGKTLAETAEKHQLDLSSTGFFNQRSEPFVPRIGNVGSAFSRFFELTEEKPLVDLVLPVEEDFVVAVLKNSQPADMSRLTTEERSSLHDSILARKHRENLSAKLAELNQQAEITLGQRMKTILEET